VDIRAPVAKKILAQVKGFGGTVVSSSDRYHSIIAYLHLGKLEALAHPGKLSSSHLKLSQ